MILTKTLNLLLDIVDIMFSRRKSLLLWQVRQYRYNCVTSCFIEWNLKYHVDNNEIWTRNLQAPFFNPNNVKGKEYIGTKEITTKLDIEKKMNEKDRNQIRSNTLNNTYEFQKTFLDPIEPVLNAIGWTSREISTLESFLN